MVAALSKTVKAGEIYNNHSQLSMATVLGNGMLLATTILAAEAFDIERPSKPTSGSSGYVFLERMKSRTFLILV
jgi:hypothetical protein